MLTVDAGSAVHFNSEDLELGNAKNGLSGGVGSGTGNWRLQFKSDTDLDVLAYIRTDDGFLTSMYDVVPLGRNGYIVPIFNPGNNRNQASQVSSLRLVNRTSRSAKVRVRAVDDRGHSPGDEVLLYVGPESARTLSSRVFEEGQSSLVGKIGTGYGKWRLFVASDRPLDVMNVMETPTGHLVNLSTRPAVESR